MNSKLASELSLHLFRASFRLLLISSFTIKLLLKTPMYLAIALIIIAPPANAVPVSSPLFISYVRTYSTGDIFIGVTTNDFCSTSVFVISANLPAKKEMLASVLIAQSMNRSILFEANSSTGCNGWGTQLQSLWLNSQ